MYLKGVKSNFNTSDRILLTGFSDVMRKCDALANKCRHALLSKSAVTRASVFGLITQGKWARTHARTRIRLRIVFCSTDESYMNIQKFICGYSDGDGEPDDNKQCESEKHDTEIGRTPD